MIELDLKKIILNADFSPIKMGLTETEVLKFLGEPEERHENGAGSVLYFYGWYEIYFFDNYLHYFQNDHISSCTNRYENNNFKIAPWFLAENEDIALTNVIKILENEECEFVVRNMQIAGKDAMINEVKIIELKSGVTMDFQNITVSKCDKNTDTEFKNFVLNGIRYDHFNIKS